jgi:hypothetical protein
VRGLFSVLGREGGGALALPGPRLGRIRIVSASVSRIDTRYLPPIGHFGRLSSPVCRVPRSPRL